MREKILELIGTLNGQEQAALRNYICILLTIAEDPTADDEIQRDAGMSLVYLQRSIERRNRVLAACREEP